MAPAGTLASLVTYCLFGTPRAHALRRRERNELQRDDVDARPQSANGPRDLVFMHVPYNFGHTIEKVALFPPSTSLVETLMFIEHDLGGFGSSNFTEARQMVTDDIAKLKKPDGVAWGHFSPELQEISNVTGCALYFTPQKYWPQDVAKKYFGDNNVFGLLRNPHERLVAMVRGSLELRGAGESYGSDFDPIHAFSCDLNGAIKDMLKKYITSGDPFQSSCAYIPQAEYYDGPYGITIPVDNMQFPSSMNKVFEEHGYEGWNVRTEDIFHVNGCPQKWSADLDAETKGLIKQVYARDFELICKHFGQCDDDLDQCIHGVPLMCPNEACHGAEPCVQTWDLSSLLFR